MASPDELKPGLPDTLPDDFFEWDGGVDPNAAAPPADSNRSSGKAQKPVWQSADRDAVLESLMDRPRVSGSAPAAPVVVKQPKDFNGWDAKPAPKSAPVNTGEWAAWDAAHTSGGNAKPSGQPTKREAVKPAPDTRSTSPTSGSSKQQRAADRKPEASAGSSVSTEWKAWDTAHSFGESPKRGPLPGSSPAAARPAVSGSASTAPKQQTTTAESNASAGRGMLRLQASSATKEASSADALHGSPAVTASMGREADQALYELFSSKNVETAEKEKTPKKKVMIMAGAGVGVVVLALAMIPLFHGGSKSAAKQPAQQAQAATETQVPADESNPANDPSAQQKPSAATPKQQQQQQAANNQPATDNSADAPAPVSARMMNQQLNAQAQIPRNQAENAPPPISFGADGLGGNGGSMGVFNGQHGGPVVKAALSRPVAISSGVATGMLIQKTPPVYPPIAKTARVSGTVELQAVISKTGRIKDLQVVSGPAMLRQAAMDAVRTWIYRPYKLNNQPTEVETTINVIFSLGG